MFKSQRGKNFITMALCLPLFACFSSGDGDSLRNDPASEGTSVTLQVNLPSGATQAQAAASIYLDGVKQPLVGGDLFLATSVDAADSQVLRSIENLSGDYLGIVDVLDNNDTVTLATIYDPELAREDRWYPIDELLVDPGTNDELTDYQQAFTFPAPISNLTIASGSQYNLRSQTVDLTWDGDAADQTNVNGVVSCQGTNGQNINYSVSRFYNGDPGAVSPFVGDFIPNDTIVNTVSTFAHGILTIISAALLEVYTFGLVDSSDISLQAFELFSCDVDLTVYREVAMPNPPGTGSGGFAIASTSDTVSFTYTP